jgi:hypothetical protein
MIDIKDNRLKKASYTASAAMPSTYKKPKPWDTDDIDKWKVRES